jgi:gliding motility-associated-like protein
MKIKGYILTISILLYSLQQVFAQPIPRIQWQKCIGGTVSDEIHDVSATNDGGYILVGSVISNNGDVSGNHSIFGAYDAWVVKVDAGGNIQWQKCFGGSLDEIGACVKQTTDGGYIFAANTISNDQQIPFNHGISDLWVVKLDASGNIQWSKTFGGSSQDVSVAGPNGINNRSKIADIEQTSNGYLIATSTRSNDGDVTGLHGTVLDIWLLKLDIAGTLQWQKCLGGTGAEKLAGMEATDDGNYMLVATTNSKDGDVSGNTNITAYTVCWIVKLDPNGSILSEKCIGVVDVNRDMADIQKTEDGGFILGGFATNQVDPNDQKNAWIVKIDINGDIVWEKIIDDGYEKEIHCINQTADGGYIATGKHYLFPFNPADADGCIYKGDFDTWVIKLTDAGTMEWQRYFGGSKWDFANRTFPTADGGYLLINTISSNDGDVVGNHGVNDGWIIKLGFTGGTAPAVTISADTNLICSPKEVVFRATPVRGGTTPIYKWILNGIDQYSGPADSALILITNSSDVVTCEITSNACVDVRTALSNSVSVVVDLSLGPKSFLGKDTSLCIPFPITLIPLRSFPKYQWSNNAITSSISVSTAGQYWLQVTDSSGCMGKDSIIVSSKICPSGFYVPGAFTPNRDGKNDIFKPIVIGKLLQYHFTIYGRWGQIVFDSKDIEKGWDGTFKGLPQDSNIFIWMCIYQLENEKVNSVKGVFALLR